MNKETFEDNKLIAEFMGAVFESEYQVKFKVEPNARNFPPKKYYHEDDLEYNLSWDWLMPACKKFNYLSDEGFIKHSDEYEKLCDALDDEITRYYDTKTTFPVLVKCIEWYNKTLIQSAPSAQ